MIAPPRAAYTVLGPDCGAPHPLAFAAPFDDAVAQLARMGYSGVEVLVRDASTLDRGTLVGPLEAAGLAVAAVSPGPMASEDGLRLDSGGEDRSRTLERMAATIELAAGLGAPVVVGSVVGSPSEPHEHQLVDDALRELDRLAGRAGTRLAIEPKNRHVTTRFTSTVETLDFVEANDLAHTGITLDTFHSQTEDRSLAGAIVRAGARLVHVQAGDNHRGPLGSGSLPVGELVDCLQAVGYTGFVSMEHAQQPDSAGAAQRSLDTYRGASGPNAGDRDTPGTPPPPTGGAQPPRGRR